MDVSLIVFTLPLQSLIGVAEKQQASIQITFPLVPGQDGDFSERQVFWDSPATIQWFKAHGYTLYRRVDDSFTTYPVISALNVATTEANYPYACYDLGGPEAMSELPRADEYTGKVAFAQDSLNRHVAIKIVRAETDEYRILHFLSQQKLETLKENCVIPVLDLLPIEGFWFAVMPRWSVSAVLKPMNSRWGIAIMYPPLYYMHEAVTIIHSLLKGLTYLHEHNIVHHDISPKNILVNHFAYDEDRTLPEHNTRGDLRSRNRLLYAMFDFDISIMLPLKEDRKAFRLPYYELWGNYNTITDTDAGEFDYSPFVFDVGAMGALICNRFQHASLDLPMLAPLLDRMTTWDLDRRFTASEALQFFEERKSELTEEQLQADLYEAQIRFRYDNYDRWEGLPLDFVEKWKAYRTAPLPWHLRFLRRLRQLPYFYYVMPITRRFFYRLSILPRRLFTLIIPSKIRI
ncbi:hypothetical protein CVT25_005617 [Psilocybe cyanescens]|uniref:Protein kinase domain-containing protein n=1 Tax=Psilocybe cyanescens TaxID=93625 RepID=A0A409X6D7_PSICY|nr:hypothetical protein CVT25_005617 [Psilocybe cyanescens]